MKKEGVHIHACVCAIQAKHAKNERDSRHIHEHECKRSRYGGTPYKIAVFQLKSNGVPVLCMLLCVYVCVFLLLTL